MSSDFSYTSPVMWLQARARIDGYAASNAFVSGKSWSAANATPRGSPFQLPAELADGLGFGSHLGHGCPRPYAPSPDRSGEFGSPAPAFRKEGQFRLLVLLHTKPHSHAGAALSNARDVKCSLCGKCD